MKTVSDILNNKGSEIWSVAPTVTVYDAIALMSEKGVGALLVMDDGDLAGIFSERDYARKVILAGKSSRDLPVQAIMTRRVLWVSPERTVQECMALMSDKRLRHLPVIDDEKVVGVISIGDLVKAIIHEQQFLIEQLQQYITGYN